MDYKKYAGFIDYACQQIELKSKELMRDYVAVNSSLSTGDGDSSQREEIRRLNRENAQQELNEFGVKTCKRFDVSYDFINKIMDLENKFNNIDNEY